MVRSVLDGTRSFNQRLLSAPKAALPERFTSASRLEFSWCARGNGWTACRWLARLAGEFDKPGTMTSIQHDNWAKPTTKLFIKGWWISCWNVARQVRQEDLRRSEARMRSAAHQIALALLEASSSWVQTPRETGIS